MSKLFGFISKCLCLLLFINLLIPAFSDSVSAQSDASLVKVSFQSPLLDPPVGYVADFGEIMGDRNGFQYGWNFDHTSETVSNATYSNSQDSSIRIQPGGEWTLSLENGTYQVQVTVGDAVYASMNSIYVEGTPFWVKSALPAGKHATLQKTIVITDGQLTVNQGKEETGLTRLNNIEVSKLQKHTPVLNPAKILEEAVPNQIPGNKVYLSGTMVNEHSAPPFMRVDGLKEAIGDSMTNQIKVIDDEINQYRQQASLTSGNDPASIQQVILNHPNPTPIVRAGMLNLESDATWGAPNKPVVLILDGLNTNRNLSIRVYGTLIVNSDLHANNSLTIETIKCGSVQGDLWVKGDLHLNNDSQLHIANQLYAGNLIYNGGTLKVDAKQVLVRDNMNINTVVQMDIRDEMLIGEIISNNRTADLNVKGGDLFVRGQVSINNQLTVKTGGLFAMGGNLVSNSKPLIESGSSVGRTKLDYTLYGLKAEYYPEKNFSGQRTLKLDDAINLTSQPKLGSPGYEDNEFSVRWTGQLTANYSDLYQFIVDIKGGARLWINDQLLIDNWTGTTDSMKGEVSLEAGQAYNIKLEYNSVYGNPTARLQWECAQQNKEVIPRIQFNPFKTPETYGVATETSFSLQWEQVFNADGYELLFDGSLYLVDSSASYSFDDLKPGTLHTYRVRAVSGDLKGKWTPTQEFWTLPDVPENIQITSTSKSISLSWSPVEGATDYEVEFNHDIVDIGNKTSYEVADLNPNMQKVFRVRAKNSSGVGKWSRVIAKATLVAVPKNLHGEAFDQYVQLSWDSVSGATSYSLEADGILFSNITETSFQHTGLTANTAHHYRIRANNADGYSEWSDPIGLTTPPSVPTGLKGEVSGDKITLSWDAVSGDVTYELEADGVLISKLTKTQYTHENLKLNSEHTYRVRAKNASIAGQWSSILGMTTHAGVPSNVKGRASATEIEVTWEVVSGATGYDIEVDGTVIRSGMIPSYTHKGLAPITEHMYRIRARNAGGAGAWSARITCVTSLNRPESLSSESYLTSIKVSWKPVSGATGYELLVDGESILVGAATEYEHEDLEPYSWHVYRVRALYKNQAGEWSAPLTQSTLLGIPGNIQVEAGSDQIALSWEPVTGATGYEVEADGVIKETDSTYFRHRGLLPNTEHHYRIRAKNDRVVSAWSDWTTLITGMTAPSVPLNFTATATTHSIQLSWTPSVGATEYELEVDGKIMPVMETSYVHNGLSPNTTHTYRVRAKNAVGVSLFTNKLKKNTTPEITMKIDKDTSFNFVMVIPQKQGLSTRQVTVTYNADQLQVEDLCAQTAAIEKAPGKIAGTHITIVSVVPGKIVYSIENADKTVMNSVKFSAKTNEFTKVTYTIE
ncbi:PA14 domain-containing protein [Gorillibacterium sp. CAU 1737]|uniref:fibronectin type III domain-containing protein n=1 Tax=Gorillibacterium sp. CAU 1737 TaxID=3140362 RepID=UPI003260B834